MGLAEQAHLRRRLEAVRKGELTEAVITLTIRIGGSGALLAALAEAQNERAGRASRRRASRKRGRS